MQKMYNLICSDNMWEDPDPADHMLLSKIWKYKYKTKW